MQLLSHLLYISVGLLISILNAEKLHLIGEAHPEQESDGRKKFNEYSNSILNNFELCEFYREKRWWLHKDSNFENRFLFVPHNIGLKMFYIAWLENFHLSISIQSIVNIYMTLQERKSTY